MFSDTKSDITTPKTSSSNKNNSSGGIKNSNTSNDLVSKTDSSKQVHNDNVDKHSKRNSPNDASSNYSYPTITPKSEFNRDGTKTAAAYQNVAKSGYLDLAKSNSEVYKSPYDNVKYGMDSAKLGYLDPMNVAYLEAAKSAGYLDVSRPVYNHFEPAKSGYPESGKIGYLEQGKQEYVNQVNMKNDYMRSGKHDYMEGIKADHYIMAHRNDYGFPEKHDYSTTKNLGYDVMHSKCEYMAQIKSEYPMLQLSPPKSVGDRGSTADPLLSLTSHSLDVSATAHHHNMMASSPHGHMTPVHSLAPTQQHTYILPQSASPKDVPVSMEGGAFSSMRVSETVPVAS